MEKVSLLTGESGVGKSLAALPMASMVTRWRSSRLGLAGLDAVSDLKSRPRAVVVLSAEDAAVDTALPRASIAGADVSRVSGLRGDGRQEIPTGETRKPASDGDETRLFRLKRDPPRLEAALEQLKQSGEELGLIDRSLGPSDKKWDRVEVITQTMNVDTLKSSSGNLIAALFGIPVLLSCRSTWNGLLLGVTQDAH